MAKNRYVWLLALMMCTSMLFGQDNSVKALNINNIPVKNRADSLLKLATTFLPVNTEQADQYAAQAAMIAIENHQQEQLALAYKLRGLSAYFINDNDLAIRFYNDALQLFKRHNNLKEVSNILNNTALAFFNKANYTQAIVLHHEALSIRTGLNDTALMIASYTNLGNSFDEAGQFEQATVFFSKALELSMLKNPESPPSGLLGNLGTTLAKAGKLTKALEVFDEAILVAQQNNSFRDLIVIYNNTGNLYRRLGDHEKAIMQLNKALEIIRLNNMVREEASVLLNIGNMFDWTRQFQPAKQFYEKAYFSFSTQNDSVGMVKALLNKGLMLEKMDAADSAIAIYTHAISIGKILNNPDLQAMGYNFLGKAHIAKGALNNGKIFIEKALKYARVNQNIIETANATQALSILFFQQKDYARSKDYALESLELNSKINYVSHQMENLLILCEIEEIEGNALAALNHYKSYVVLRDSLFNMQKMEQITAIEGKFNLALKEEELKNKTLKLQQKTEQLNRTNERAAFAIIGLLFVFVTTTMLINWSRLKQSRNKVIAEQSQLETEYRLLRAQMNPHFMFNALNSIQSFISVNNTMQAEMYLSKFARLMRYYLDSSSMSFVPMQTEIDNLQLNLELEQLRLSFRFDFKIVVPEDVDDIEVPPMLAQPFIENAVRHGFRRKKDQGLLQITYEKRDDIIKCTIQDNGIGREAAGKIKSNHENKVSKGIEITKGRLSALFPKQEASELLKITDLYHTDGSAAGTKVEFIFPSI